MFDCNSFAPLSTEIFTEAYQVCTTCLCTCNVLAKHLQLRLRTCIEYVSGLTVLQISRSLMTNYNVSAIHRNVLVVKLA